MTAERKSGAREGPLAHDAAHDTGAPVAVGLGSNLGDRARHLAAGVRALEGLLDGLRCSTVYESEPQGVEGHPPFLNACCVGRTELPPEELLERLHDIEREAGRIREPERKTPRTLDLDLLLYGERVIHTPELRIPHPRLPERAFVLVPLAEIAPEWPHPETGRTVDEMAKGADPTGVRAVSPDGVLGSEDPPDP